MTTLASTAGTYDPDGDGSNDWNITFWDTTIAPPPLGAYDVLVIGSPDLGFGTGIDVSGVVAHSAAIAAARGSRTFLSGQDADYHYRSSPGPVDNGPRGFIINAVNWAASGTGLGIVSMTDGWVSTGSQWWTEDGSFLKAELDGYNEYFQSESVQLGLGQSGFPVNEGLTSAGLSNWGTSSHSGFDPSIPGYTTINFEGAGSTGRAITIVTKGLEDAPTDPDDPDNPEKDPTPSIPLPMPAFLLLGGLATLGATRRLRR